MQHQHKNQARLFFEQFNSKCVVMHEAVQEHTLNPFRKLEPELKALMPTPRTTPMHQECPFTFKKMTSTPSTINSNNNKMVTESN